MRIDENPDLRPLQPAPRALVGTFVVLLGLTLSLTVHFGLRSLDRAADLGPGPAAVSSSDPSAAPSKAVLGGG